jgi:hypothetical protein
MNDTAAPAETCGHEHEFGYRCERTPHPVNDPQGSNIPGAPYRHAAAISAEHAKGTDEDDGHGEADLITWGEDDNGDGQDWDVAWGDVTDFADRSHGTCRENRG